MLDHPTNVWDLFTVTHGVEIRVQFAEYRCHVVVDNGFKFSAHRRQYGMQFSGIFDSHWGFRAVIYMVNRLGTRGAS